MLLKLAIAAGQRRVVCTHLNVKRRVEAHCDLIVLIALKDLDERLFEDLGVERIGQDHVAVREIRKGLHFEETDLIQTSSEDIN